MQVTRNGIETVQGPEDWFTGAVYLDSVAAPSDGSRLSASSVHFTPGARNVDKRGRESLGRRNAGGDRRPRGGRGPASS